MRPLQNQWLSGSQAIDEFLAAQGAQAMQGREQTMMQAGMGLSQPYQQQIVPVAGTAPTTSPWAKILGSMMGGAGSSLMGGAVGQMFSPSSQITGGVGGVNTGMQSTGGQQFPTWSPYNATGQRVY
jgi:hypothetical protein